MNHWLITRENKEYWRMEEEKPCVSIDPETWFPRKGILTRYGRKLIKEVAKYYENLKRENFVI